LGVGLKYLGDVSVDAYDGRLHARDVTAL
jgi:hypothetical protein